MGTYVYRVTPETMAVMAGGHRVDAARLAFAYAMSSIGRAPGPRARRDLAGWRAFWRGRPMPRLAAVVDADFREGGRVYRWRQGQVTAHDDTRRGIGGRPSVGTLLLLDGTPTLFASTDADRWLRRRDLAALLARDGLAEVASAATGGRLTLSVRPTREGLSARRWALPPPIWWQGMRDGPAAYFEEVGCPLDRHGLPMDGVSDFRLSPIGPAEARAAGALA